MPTFKVQCVHKSTGAETHEIIRSLTLDTAHAMLQKAGFVTGAAWEVPDPTDQPVVAPVAAASAPPSGLTQKAGCQLGFIGVALIAVGLLAFLPLIFVGAIVFAAGLIISAIAPRDQPAPDQVPAAAPVHMTPAERAAANRRTVRGLVWFAVFIVAILGLAAYFATRDKPPAGQPLERSATP